MKLISFLLVLFTLNAFALEVDEKLTARILKTSDTRKTVMVNRGIEDGLAEGDHAKFIVTAGIIARGLVVKVSPTRSVWAIYRLVNADYIVNDSVVTLKITPPVKLTKDESQTLVQEDVPSRVQVTDPTKLGIPLAEGALDEPEQDDFSASDLRALEGESSGTIFEKNFEVFGMLNISGLSASTKTDIGSENMKSTQSSQHIGLGLELYSKNERAWYSSFSLSAQVSLVGLSNQSYTGGEVKNDVTEFEVGVNWHPGDLPSKTMTFIPYLHGGFAMGTVKSTAKPGFVSPPGSVEESAKGKTNGFSLGFGYKFYTSKGYAFRALLDYYMRAEKYDPDMLQQNYNKTVSGPRLTLGLGYRF